MRNGTFLHIIFFLMELKVRFDSLQFPSWFGYWRRCKGSTETSRRYERLTIGFLFTVDCINEAHQQTKSVIAVIENTAGQVNFHEIHPFVDGYAGELCRAYFRSN
jgi:hypothetical protein